MPGLLSNCQVPHLLSDLGAHLLCHSARDRDRCNPARLRAGNRAAARKPGIEEEARDLRRLAAARLPDDDQRPVCLDELDQLLPG